MTVDLDPQRPGPMVSQIAQSILSELARTPGATIKVRLDVEGALPAGYSADVVTVIRDNAATLRIGSAAFNRE